MEKSIFATFFIIILATGSVLGAVGCGKSSDAGSVLATYDGGSVSEEDFKFALDQLPERVRAVALRQKKEFIESYVSEKLLLQEAESKGLQHLQEVKDLIRKSRDRILVAKLMENEVDLKTEVSEKEQRSYFENNKEEFKTPFRLRASHILLRSREEADEVRERLVNGENFEELAKTHSLDPSASKGGDIGFFQKGQLIPEIEETAYQLREGELSEVVQTTFGFHIVKVTGEAKPQVKEYETVKNEILQKLTLEKRTEHFNRLMNKIKNKGKMEIDDKAIEAFSYE